MSDKLKERKVSRLSADGSCALMVWACDSPNRQVAGPTAGTWPPETSPVEESCVVWEGNENRERRRISWVGTHAWWPSPHCPGAQFGGAALRIGRLQVEHTRAGVRGRSLCHPSVEVEG